MKVIGTRGRLTSKELGQQTQDISKRSITPDTHKARIMSHDLKDFNPQQLLHDPEGFWLQISQEIIPERSAEEEVKQEDVLLEQIADYSFYIDSYTHLSLPTSRVLHFGINTYKEGLKEGLKTYNEQMRQGLSNNLEKMSNISGESNYGKFIDKITPTHVENHIVINAVQYLENTGNKTVLIDFFPRVLNSKTEGAPVGTIKLSENIETHTALLYSVKEKILVIDPNNPQFSAFLKNVKPDIMQSSYRTDDKIYMRAGETGPDTWRDCIDIAVKLAFVLNRSEAVYLSIGDIMNSQEIQLITNNSEINESIFYSSTNPVREKQTSDLERVRLFNNDLEQKNILFNQYQDFLDKAKRQADKKLVDIFENALTSNSNISETIFNNEIPSCFVMGEIETEQEFYNV